MPIWHFYNILNKHINKDNNNYWTKYDIIRNTYINLKKNPKDKTRKVLWNFCINKQIDINTTDINNKNKILEKDYSKTGFTCHLFNIFKNNHNFCLEKKQEICEICEKVYELDENLYILYIIINEENIEFDI